LGLPLWPCSTLASHELSKEGHREVQISVIGAVDHALRYDACPRRAQGFLGTLQYLGDGAAFLDDRLFNRLPSGGGIERAHAGILKQKFGIGFGSLPDQGEKVWTIALNVAGGSPQRNGGVWRLIWKSIEIF
jgi:hypothetical protein